MNDNSRPPLLSVCVPTYNRAGWLAATIAHIAPQIAATNGLAELVVSDNASRDDTRRVVERAQRRFGAGAVRYHRNGSNIGAHPNFYLLVSELAQGEFVWMLGDDDFLLPGAVQRVLDVLQGHPELDYIYVNHARFPVAGAPEEPVTTGELAALSHLVNENKSDTYVERVADLIGDDEFCFAPNYASIFRKHHAVAAFKGSLQDPPFTTLASVFSHAMYVADNLLQKPCWYIGRPYVVCSTNCSYPKHVAVFQLVLLPALYDYFESRGADAKKLDVFRRQLILASGPLIRHMLFGKNTFGREQFHLGQYLWRYRHFKETYLLLRHLLLGTPYRRIMHHLWMFRPTELLLRRMHPVYRALRPLPAATAAAGQQKQRGSQAGRGVV